MTAAAALETLASDPIREVRCYDCSVPLPRPLIVGQATVTSRTYAVIRIRTASGLEGAAYAFGRGLPVSSIIEQSLVPLLLGADPTRPELIRRKLAGAYWSYADRGLFSVAASAVDLALWDLLGQRLGVPLADILGRSQNEVPVCGVGGYKLAGVDGLDQLQAEMSAFMDLGCRAVKLTVGADDPAADARRLAAVREVIGGDCALVVDAFRSFTRSRTPCEGCGCSNRLISPTSRIRSRRSLRRLLRTCAAAPGCSSGWVRTSPDIGRSAS